MAGLIYLGIFAKTAPRAVFWCCLAYVPQQQAPAKFSKLRTAFRRTTNPQKNMFCNKKQKPRAFKFIAILKTIFLILSIVSLFKSCAGNTNVESPLWTPAFSICSLIARITTFPLSATASTSISFASSINLLITTG